MLHFAQTYTREKVRSLATLSVTSCGAPVVTHRATHQEVAEQDRAAPGAGELTLGSGFPRHGALRFKEAIAAQQCG